MKKTRNVHSNPQFHQLNLLKINDTCKVNTLSFIYKSVNNLAHSPLQFQTRRVPRYQLRNDVNQLLVPFSRHNYVQSFICIRGPNLWNSIPQAIRESRTIITFKRKIKKFYIDSYSEWSWTLYVNWLMMSFDYKNIITFMQTLMSLMIKLYLYICWLLYLT